MIMMFKHFAVLQNLLIFIQVLTAAEATTTETSILTSSENPTDSPSEDQVTQTTDIFFVTGLFHFEDQVTQTTDIISVTGDSPSEDQVTQTTDIISVTGDPVTVDPVKPGCSPQALGMYSNNIISNDQLSASPDVALPFARWVEGDTQTTDWCVYDEGTGFPDVWFQVNLRKAYIVTGVRMRTADTTPTPFSNFTVEYGLRGNMAYILNSSGDPMDFPSEDQVDPTTGIADVTWDPLNADLVRLHLVPEANADSACVAFELYGCPATEDNAFCRKTAESFMTNATFAFQPLEAVVDLLDCAVRCQNERQCAAFHYNSTCSLQLITGRDLSASQSDFYNRCSFYPI